MIQFACRVGKRADGEAKHATCMKGALCILFPIPNHLVDERHEVDEVACMRRASQGVVVGSRKS